MAAGPSNIGASTSKPPKPKTGGRVDKKQAAHTAHVKAATSNAQELAKHVASQFVAAVLDTRHIVVIERMFQRETPVCVCCVVHLLNLPAALLAGPSGHEYDRC